MPVEFPSDDLMEHYRVKLELETVKEFKSNGYYKKPIDEHIFVLGFREGYSKAKKYFFHLACLK